MKKVLITAAFVAFTVGVSFSQETSVKPKQPFTKAMLEGRWFQEGSTGTYFEYLPNGEVRDIVDFEDYTDPDDGPITYRLEERNDTLFLIHRYRQRIVNSENVIGHENRCAVRISGDCMESLCFKSGEGINSHIDEYEIRIRLTNGKPRLFDANMPITKYILPKGFKGHVAIAFNQPSGIAPEYDTQGNRIVRIPPGGILKTQMKEDAFGMAGKRFAVMIQDSTSQTLTQLPSYHRFEDPEKQESLKNTFGVIMQGFNQLPREDVNRLFGQPIAGNVLMFFVDTYGNAGRIQIAAPWF